MLFVLDNYDSFTYNLVDYLFQCGEQCIVKRNDEISVEEIKALNPEAIVLSPGPNTPQESGILMEVVDAFHKTKPILGICLGYQAIAEYFGAKLLRAERPMHGMTSWVKHNNDALFNEMPNPFEAMRYHSLIINDLSETDLVSLAHTEANELMALKHKELPIYGVQFHPESILTTHGMQLLKNWIVTLKL